MAQATQQLMQQVGFADIREGKAEDFELLAGQIKEFAKGLPDRMLRYLENLGNDCGGLQITRLEHSLQTATRAHQAGEDEEYVVCALLHDIGDLLCTHNHPEMAATILHPFVSEANHWMVQHHGIFQGYYFFHHIGLDRNMREQFQGNPHFEHTVKFCEKYDAPAFNPSFESMPLEAFRPMLQRVMATPQRSVYQWA